MMVLTGACIEVCEDVFPRLLIENLKRAIRNRIGPDEDFQIDWNEDLGVRFAGVWLWSESPADLELIGTGRTELESLAAAYEQLRAWGAP